VLYLELYYTNMIARNIEKKKIQRILKSPKSEFLAVTGRRRVGKTFLIDELLGQNYCFNLTGIQNGSTAMQLMNFSIKLAEYKGEELKATPTNWQMAFLELKTYLKTLPKKQKQVIFIDELPWVYTSRSKFIQLLAHLWNDYLSKEKHFILVICGSATSWISKKIINDTGGLHNRVTELIHLSPFTLSETKMFLTSKGLHLTNQEIVKIYMTLGGIPFYLEAIQKGEGFVSSIERLCFSPTGLLKNEYTNLYQALFNNADLHLAIVAVLAKSKEGLTQKEILKKTGISHNGSYQRAIEELLISNFINEIRPFGKKKRGSYYRLIDEFSVFYYRFIKPNKKYTKGMWQQLSNGQSFKIWAGYAFESLCHKHIDEIKKAIGIQAVYTEISSLNISSSKTQIGFQIDLLIDRKDDCINLCEIKFHTGPFTIDKRYYQQLTRKRQAFVDYSKTSKQVFLTLICNHGLNDNMYANEIVEVSIDLEDLFDK